MRRGDDGAFTFCAAASRDVWLAELSARITSHSPLAREGKETVVHENRRTPRRRWPASSAFNLGPGPRRRNAVAVRSGNLGSLYTSPSHAPLTVQLVDLNRRIVERLRLIRSARQLVNLARFSVGMRVEFTTDDGQTRQVRSRG
jgi:hypothetical protein